MGNNNAQDQTARRNDNVRASLAGMVAAMSIIDKLPHASRESAACRAEGIAMGILHGCCGPNGDFTSEYRAEKK